MSAFQTHIPLPRPQPFRSRSVCRRCRAPVRSVAQNAAVSSVKPSQKPASAQSQSITPRHEDYSQWYLDVITAADLSESAPVKGCLVIKPHGYAIWELLRDKLDSAIKASGAKNAYFPLLIPQSFLSKEAEHVEGFAKECAVVTHHRLRADPDAPPGTLQPDPDAQLEENLVVRPTSETIIWYMFGRWIQSYRDLPLMLNQWANVVRWEMRTRPFLRTAEFLWQEGHTAHADAEEAHDKAREMIQVYRDIAENWLALPVVVGRKSPSERFAGAEETYTIEAMMQNGWALQAGTSHFLGQNFAKAFDVQYKAPDGTKQYVWATSWGMTTRMIGALIMTHSDDVGLVLPPNVAPIQIVLVLIFKNEKEQELVTSFAKGAADRLREVGIRIEVDDRPNMRPGAKYYEWERKGVPLRMEIGPRDAGKGAVFAAKRLGGKKWSIPVDDAFEDNAQEVLTEIHTQMLENARQRLMSRTSRPSSYEELKQSLGQGGESQGFFVVPWKCDDENEKKVKDETKATLRCYPMDEQDDVKGRTCIYSGEPATHMAIFARAY
ncbi:Proline--tRNA ligase [Gracilariopsis chorda]|uniref:proline--tRNA ligase n=1 Tax=Gracilariopsis chorda TaxID=448386 RepID=A0A2V3IUN6_9FLOR|nr:Proline--tRNA ligase [Gracilariopsis chorda]|eukprot:PXF45834.1 Proline--tRNA ligase [Gracilariopsis chorda]